MRAWLFQPLVLDIAEEARPQKGVGLLHVGEIRGQQHSLDLKSTIRVGGSDFSTLADNKVLVAVAYNLKTVVWVCLVEPRTPMTGVVDPSNGVSFRASDPGKAH